MQSDWDRVTEVVSGVIENQASNELKDIDQGPTRPSSITTDTRNIVDEIIEAFHRFEYE